MIKLQYGNTNTFFIDGLLVDTDYAGTLPAFYREIKRNRIRIKDTTSWPHIIILITWG